MTKIDIYEETEDLSDYDDEEYDNFDEEYELIYDGFIELDEDWNKVEEVSDFEYIED
jgi:hypothetical protein